MDRLRSFSKLSKVSKIKPTVNLVIGFIGFILIFVFIALHLYYLPSTSGCDNTNKELSFFTSYFDKYSYYLSKKSFNYFTTDVISLKF